MAKEKAVKDERLKRTHVRDWHELARVFPFDEKAATDPELLSPDGGHVETGDPERPWELVSASHPDLRDKVPAVTPHVILQDQHPDGEKDIEHVELTDAEWAKLKTAYEKGLLDPEGNGTNRYVSQLSLTDLGLGRIEKMLGEGRTSGAREQVIL